MIFGPFRDQRLFRLRQSEFMQRLMGLSLYHDRVWGILPLEQEESLKCKEWLEERLSLKEKRRTGPIEFKYMNIGAANALPDPEFYRELEPPSGGPGRHQ